MWQQWNNRGIVNFANRKHVNSWIPPDILEQIPYTRHTVMGDEVGRLDLISFREYGSEQYFWVLAHYNLIQDPFNGFRVNFVMKVPNLNQYLEAWSAYAALRR